MGLRADIYRAAGYGDCSNHGISSRVNRVTIVNAEGPFEPTEDAPAVELVVRNLGGEKYVHARPVACKGKWTMHGGTYIETSDSRFREAVSKLTELKHAYPVALHDRVEE